MHVLDLSPDDAQLALDSKLSPFEVAKEFQISVSAVKALWAGHVWRELTPAPDAPARFLKSSVPLEDAELIIRETYMVSVAATAEDYQLSEWEVRNIRKCKGKWEVLVPPKKYVRTFEEQQAWALSTTLHLQRRYRLTPDEWHHIQDNCAAIPQALLANKYGVTQATISNVVNHKGRFDRRQLFADRLEAIMHPEKE